MVFVLCMFLSCGQCSFLWYPLVTINSKYGNTLQVVWRLAKYKIKCKIKLHWLLESYMMECVCHTMAKYYCQPTVIFILLISKVVTELAPDSLKGISHQPFPEVNPIQHLWAPGHTGREVKPILAWRSNVAMSHDISKCYIVHFDFLIYTCIQFADWNP